MLNHLSYRELNVWIEYFSIEPFPEEREDLRNAQLLTLLANIWRNKDTKEFEIKDFLLDFWGEIGEKKEPPEKLFKKVEMLNQIFRGKDLRNK